LTGERDDRCHRVGRGRSRFYGVHVEHLVWIVEDHRLVVHGHRAGDWVPVALDAEGARRSPSWWPS
jgi:hypothetical protein